MSALHRILGIGLGALGIITQACTLASPTYITAQESKAEPEDGGAATTDPGSSPSSDKAATAGSATCGADDYVKPDLSKLTACGDGKGHCFAKDKISLSDMLTACPNADEVCVPDEILEANGQPLKKCTSIIGEGGCVTASLIPEIEKQGGSALKQDACNAGQLCVPCTDPTNGNAPTPFCQPIGVHENACSAGGAAGGGNAGGGNTAAMPCCTTKGKSNGVCISESAIPEDQREDAPNDTCKEGDKCVPAAFVEGKPVKCDGGTLRGPGVCMDKCFNSMMGFAGSIGLLTTEGCGETEVCVPCKFLEDQGVPGCN
jgi:hypothetical protein